MSHSQKNFLIRLVQGCLVLSLFTPLVVGMSHLFPFVFPKALFFQFWVAVGVAAYALLVLHDRSYLPKPSLALWLLIGWGVSLTLAGLFGFNPVNSLWSKAERMDGLWTYAHLFAFSFMLLGVLKTRQDWGGMLKLNAGAGVLVGIAALMSKYSPSLSALGDQTRLAGTFGNPAFLGTYFVFFVFTCLLLAALARAQKEMVLWICGALVGMILVLMSGTRGAYLGTVAGIGVWVLGLFLFGTRQSRIIGIVLVCALAGLGASLVVARPVWEKTLPMIASRVYSITSIPPQRVLVWQVGLQAFKAKPLFGWGQENFLYAFNRFFDPAIFKYEVAIFDRPHNKMVEVLVTSGIAGLATYLGLFIALAWGVVRRIAAAWKARSGWSPELGMGIGLVALWAAYHVQNLVLFEMPTSAIQLFFALALSLWFLTGRAENGEPHDPRARQPLVQNSRWRSLAYGGILVLVGWSVGKGILVPWQASKQFIGAMVNLSQPMTQEYYEQGQALYTAARSKNTFLSKEFDINFSRHLRALNVPYYASWFKNQIALGHQVLGYLEQDLERYQEDYDILVEMSNLMLDFQVKYQDLEAGSIPDTLARAIAFSPRRLEAYEALFTHFSAVDDKAKAQGALATLFSLAAEVGDTWYYQAVYNAQWGKHDQTLDDLRKALSYGFALHDRLREQEWLLNLYVSRSRFGEALNFLEFLRTEPHASAQQQLRYMLLEIEVVYLSGDTNRATLLLQDLLARMPEQNKPMVVQYLQGRGIVLEP